MKSKMRLHYIFYGSVQGVGFRYQAYYMARKLGLSGWVKNLYDGTVEMEVQGKEELIDALILSFYVSNFKLKGRNKSIFHAVRIEICFSFCRFYLCLLQRPIIYFGRILYKILTKTDLETIFKN